MLFMLKTQKSARKIWVEIDKVLLVGFSLQKHLQKNFDYKKADPEACVTI